jgi:membrane fusion protein, macrolide-specific efflux system
VRRSLRAAVWLLVVAAGVGAGVAGSHIMREHGSDADSATVPRVPGRQTVQVVRRDIAVVTALDGVTVPLPTVRVLAPGAGTIRYVARLATNGEVRQGAALFRMGSEDVKAPVTARFERWLVPDDANVGSGVPVVELRYMGFGLVGSLPSTDSYRLLSGNLTATASIIGGPAGFRCPVLQVPSVKADSGATPSASPVVMCAIPPDVRAFPDLKGQIAVTSGQVTNVLTLPVTAVSGAADRGEVSVVLDDGTVVIRQVGLGATDGAIVEITAGLEEGTRVLASPPPLMR